MPNYSRMISVNRDNIISMTSEATFFEKNPGLLFLKEELDACRGSFDESAKKAGCKCRADAGLLHGCVSKFLTTLDVAKEINKPLVEDFVRYVGKVDNIAGVGVTIFYVKPGEKTPHRYTFPE